MFQREVSARVSPGPPRGSPAPAIGRCGSCAAGSPEVGFSRAGMEGAMGDSDRFPRTLRIGILVFDGFEPIDVWGFTEAFTISRFIGTGYDSDPPYPFEVVFISNQCKPEGGGASPAPVKSYNGPRVAPDYFRDEALEQKIDLLM